MNHFYSGFQVFADFFNQNRIKEPDKSFKFSVSDEMIYLQVSNFRVGAEIIFCELKFGFGFGSLYSKSVRSSIFRRNSPTEFSRR